MAQRIGVLGATGNVGGGVASRLIKAGIRPRLIVRNIEALAPQLRDGGDVAQADLRDRESVLEACKELDALFWFTPPDLSAGDVPEHYRAMGALAAESVRKGAIRRVVQLSAAGADGEDFGIINGQRFVEEALTGSVHELVILRPSYFYENFLRQAGPLAREGRLYEPMPSDALIPMIAAEDIAQVAAEELLDAAAKPGTRIIEMTGSESHSLASVLAAFGEVLDRRFEHIQVPLEAVGEIFLQQGASPSVAAAYVEMHRALCEGRAQPQAKPDIMVTTTGARAFASGPLATALHAAADGFDKGPTHAD